MDLSSVRAAGRRIARSSVLFLVVGIVVGVGVAPYAYGFTQSEEPTVAVVPIEGGIDGEAATAITAQLRRARQDSSVAAVVLLVNSPGGGAGASETLYMSVSRTAEEKPVVASVDATAASGGYYAIAPAEQIYVKPSTIIGSVGVLARAPRELEPQDAFVTSGPYKLAGGSERGFRYNVESLRRAFVNAIYEHRGDRLSISRSELSTGRVFQGGSAVRAGVADRIGGLGDAVRAAALEAGVSSYRVEVFRNEDVQTRFLTRRNYVASDAENKTMISATYFTGRGDPAMPTYLYLAPSVVTADEATVEVNASDGD